MATTDEQKAICYVLERLRVDGDAWLRHGAINAEKSLRAAKRYEALERGDLATLLMHGGKKGSFDETRVIYLKPPAKEDTAVAALWCRWDYEKPLPRCGFYFGLWSAQPAFPKPTEGVGAAERHIAFIGYRFETPEEDDNHNYYHAQPCRSMGRKDDEIDVALPISYRMPTWPIAATGALELLLCLVTSLYGMKGLRELYDKLLEDAKARQNKLLLAAFKSVMGLSCSPASVVAVEN